MFYKEKIKIFKGGKDYQANETIKIKDGKIIKRYINTPEKIYRLEKFEIIVVFENGKEGLDGQKYVLPLLNNKGIVDNLIQCACKNTEKIFLVKENKDILNEIKGLFKREDLPANIILPKNWE